MLRRSTIYGRRESRVRQRASRYKSQIEGAFLLRHGSPKHQTFYCPTRYWVDNNIIILRNISIGTRMQTAPRIVVCDPLAVRYGGILFYSSTVPLSSIFQCSHWPRCPLLRQWWLPLHLGPRPHSAARRGGNRRGKAMRDGGGGLHTWPAVSQTIGGQR